MIQALSWAVMVLVANQCLAQCPSSMGSQSGSFANSGTAASSFGFSNANRLTPQQQMFLAAQINAARRVAAMNGGGVQFVNQFNSGFGDNFGTNFNDGYAPGNFSLLGNNRMVGQGMPTTSMAGNVSRGTEMSESRREEIRSGNIDRNMKVAQQAEANGRFNMAIRYYRRAANAGGENGSEAKAAVHRIQNRLRGE